MKKYLLLTLLLVLLGCEKSSPTTPITQEGSGELSGKIVQYFDFDCPYCEREASNLLSLKKENPKLQLEFRHFIIHPQVTLAHEAFQCAKEQGKGDDFYFKYFSDFFGATALSELKELAHSINVNLSQFEGCLAQGRKQILNQEKSLGMLLGVSGTPHLIVNDKIHFSGSTSEESLKEALR